MLPGFERFDDLAHTVLGGLIGDIGLVEQTAQLVVQGFGSGHVDAVGIRPVSDAVGMWHLLHLAALVFHFHLFAVHRAKGIEPFMPEGRVQGVERGGRGFFEVELAGEGLDIGNSDLTRGDLQVEVRGLPADGGTGSQTDDTQPGLELALQAHNGLFRV